MRFSRFSLRRRGRSKIKFRKAPTEDIFRKQFSRFQLCDSLLSCFSVTMIALQFAQIEKGAAKGLCLEFILHEYAKSLAIMERLAGAPDAEALAILEKLFADTLNTDAIQQPGILDKLCFYCEALVQTSKIGENLLDAIDELRIAVSLPRAALARQQRAIPYSSTRPMGDLLSSLFDKLRAFFPLLAPVFLQALECEAALFTLLELRKEINRHLGQNVVENLLQQLFPDGPDGLRQALTSGFARRGFGDFYERHESLFEGLAWPHPTELYVSKPCS
jgi:hypothetical protein